MAASRRNAACPQLSDGVSGEPARQRSPYASEVVYEVVDDLQAGQADEWMYQLQAARSAQPFGPGTEW